jgi:hypothetical protein
MAYMLTKVQVDDFEVWKPLFDSDPAGARREAKGHRILQAAEDPNEVFIQVEFGSAEDAKAARKRLLDSGALERVDVKAGPTVAEEAETVSY